MINMVLNAFWKLWLNLKGKKANKEEIYYVEISGNVSGFFALLRIVLDHCCYAEENGFFPYIKYSNEILYAEKKFFWKNSNPFEYYFEQPIANRKFNFIGINIVKPKGKELDTIEQKYNSKPFSYLVEEDYIDRMAKVYRKYICLNRDTKEKINSSILRILKGKKTLGIHIRGTDFYKHFNNHPVPVMVDEYLDVIELECRQRNYEQIFVATDDKRCLQEIKRRIHVPLVYYKNVMRADGYKSVSFERSERKHNNYLLGLEILRDVYTLVSCDGFLGCLSQVDTFVQIIKKSRREEFDYLNIINKGIFTNNRECWEPLK